MLFASIQPLLPGSVGARDGDAKLHGWIHAFPGKEWLNGRVRATKEYPK